MDSYTARGLRLAVLFGAGLGLMAAGILTSLAPAGAERDRTLVMLTVRLDTQFTEVAQMLRDAGAISSVDQFVERARARAAVDQVKIGPHTIVMGDTPDQILDKLTQPGRGPTQR